MKVLYERCCGLDVHKKSLTACALTPAGPQVRGIRHHARGGPSVG